MKPVTIFTGQVNGKTFKNRKEMEQYISTCIANSQPITSISYKNETKFVDENAGAGTPFKPQGTPKTENFGEYLMKLQWPAKNSHPTPVKYLVPFVIEEAFGDDHDLNQVILKDGKEKLGARLQWMENNIFGVLRNTPYEHWDRGSVETFLNYLAHCFKCKQRWAEARVENLCSMRLTSKDEHDEICRLNAGLLRIEKLDALVECYREVAAFCAACYDIIVDQAKELGLVP